MIETSGLSAPFLTGNIDTMILGLGDDKDFTLTAPPDNSKPYRWLDGKWI